MDKPSFYRLERTAYEFREVLLRSVDGEVARLFSTDEDSFVSYLTNPALDRLLDEYDSVEEILREVGRLEGADRDTFLDEVVEVAGIQNPFRLYDFSGSKGFTATDFVPDGILLPFRKDPVKINIKASRFVDIRIEFAEDGAEAQQHRAPGMHGGSTFKHRSAALDLMDSGSSNPNKRLNKVHVVIVDQGLDPNFVNDLGGHGTYAKRIWFKLPPNFPRLPIPVEPGQGELPLEHRHRYRSMPQWHAHMIVRNILSIAGDNRNLARNEEPILFYDVPVIPDRVGEVGAVVFNVLFQNLAIGGAAGEFDPNDLIIVVNAWGIKNRLREIPQGDVSENENHPLQWTITELLKLNNIAVVFAAGNTGAFTPDPEASPYDRGPGRSIWLPNSRNGLFNAGACDCIGKWIGSSSQGPGAKNAENPMFVTPSYFREDLDAHVANTGSSASCALLAGVIARRWRENAAPLDVVGAKSSAKKFGFTDHSQRLGHGIVAGGF